MPGNPLDANPPSRATTLQASTEAPIIQSGKVASLIQLHNSREGDISVEPPAPLRTVTRQRSQRADTLRNGSSNPSASRMLSWRALTKQQPTLPHGCDTPRSPQSRGRSSVRRDSRPVDFKRSHQAPNFSTPRNPVPDYDEKQPQSNANRADPWARQGSDHWKSSRPHRDQSLSLPIQPKRYDQLLRSQTPERQGRGMKRQILSLEMGPVLNESMPAVSQSEIQRWSLSRDTSCRESWPKRHTSSQRSGSSYQGSGQALFYEDLSPRHPPAPQVSPAGERANPWRRRDSSGSTVRSQSPRAKREALSHRAFERVRTMSPPVDDELQMHGYFPQHPSNPSIESYITRKLSQHWSGAPVASTKASQSTTSPTAHHIDSSLVQDILHSIDSVLAEHTTALQTVITQSRQLLHEKELLCPSISPQRSPTPGPVPDCVSPQQNDDNEHNSGSTSPKGPSLSNSPKLLRRRTNSIPGLIQLIDSTATNFGIELPPELKRSSLTLPCEPSTYRERQHQRSSSEPILTQRDIARNTSYSSDESQAPLIRTSSKTSGKAKILSFDPPPNTRNPSLGSCSPTAMQSGPTSQQDHPTSATQGIIAPPTLAVLTPSTPAASPSLSVSPDLPIQLLPLSAPQDNTSLLPSEEVDESHSIHRIITTSEPPPSQKSYPEIYPLSNMSSPSFIEYDRDAALAERATRNSIKDMTGTPHFANNTPRMLSEPINNALILANMPLEAVNVPEPVRSSVAEEICAPRNITRQISDTTERTEEKLSRQKKRWWRRRRSTAQSSSLHSESSAPPNSEVPSTSPEPQVPRTRTATPPDNSSEEETFHSPATEPQTFLAEATTRRERLSRSTRGSMQDRLPSPWQASESRTTLAAVTSESGEEHARATPDHGPVGQFWATDSGSEVGRKWFGRHGVVDEGPESGP